MSVTEQIIEVVERVRALGLSDAEIDEILFSYRVHPRRTSVERVDRLLYDQVGQERFVICTHRFGFV